MNYTFVVEPDINFSNIETKSVTTMISRNNRMINTLSKYIGSMTTIEDSILTDFTAINRLRLVLSLYYKGNKRLMIGFNKYSQVFVSEGSAQIIGRLINKEDISHIYEIFCTL